MPSRGQFARFCYHVALLGFILAASCGYLGGVLASYWALFSHPHPIMWPLCILLMPCCAVGIHFGAVIWPFWERFGIMLCFMLASISHPVVNLHDFVTMLRCWDSFWHHDALYARAQIPSRGHCASSWCHVALLRFILELLSGHFGCILVSCCALGIHLELLSGHFRCVLTSWWTFCSRPDAIVWPMCGILPPCWVVGIHFGAVI